MKSSVKNILIGETILSLIHSSKEDKLLSDHKKWQKAILEIKNKHDIEEINKLHFVDDYSYRLETSLFCMEALGLLNLRVYPKIYKIDRHELEAFASSDKEIQEAGKIISKHLKY